MDGTGHDSTAPAAAGTPYRVLARKYRPKSFADLIGQEPMVRTLTNAFRTGRIAQAYMLTGVRGVGKTTTARILARALNYSIPGKVDRPSIDLDELGEHCAAIMEGRHVDVIEMDAASHTGIDDIREIIEASRYRPAIARYKVYIIDEVHMLSKAAFNGLLKTLEEPPEHVKFIFATTEIRKVPVTVLSRCQRFDLRRIEAGRLVELMRTITAAENIAVEDDAFRMIARAAEGSARDSLSLLDQAIAHPDAMRGDVPAALARLKSLHDVGAEPAVVLEDLAAFTHLVTRIKVAPGADEDEALSEEERLRGKEIAGKLTLRALTRAWQMLLKGIDEAREASKPLAAADMVLVRLAHASDLPTPDEALKSLRDSPAPRSDAPSYDAPPSGNGGARMSAGNGGPMLSRPSPAPSSAPRAAAEPTIRLDSFNAIVAQASAVRDLRLKHALETYIRLVRFEPGKLEIGLTPEAPSTLVGDLSKRLEQWTGQRWMIAVAREATGQTIEETRREARDQMVSDARADPVVAAVMARFPGAEIVDVRIRADENEAAALPDIAPSSDPEEMSEED
jgi:DNA polymerase-3 subunit gamma/tau